MTVGTTVLGIASYLLKVWDLYGLAWATLLMCCADLLIYAFVQMMADGLAQMMVDVLSEKRSVGRREIGFPVPSARTYC